MPSLFSTHSGLQQPPISNEGLVAPSKLPGYRWCTYFVLYSFFFQTLWPSVAFAMDGGGVEVLRPPSPLGFRIGSIGRPDSPQLSLEVFSDTEEESDDEGGRSSPPRLPPQKALFQKTFHPSDITATVAPLLATRALYGQLQVKTEGIEWFAQGLWMTINWQGELLVRGDERATTAPQPVILQNAHKVFLGEGLSINHLKVTSPLIVNLGKDNRIGLLEAIAMWVSAGGDEEGAAQPPLFQNALGASLTVKHAVLGGMQWQNQGQFCLSGGGVFDAGGVPVENIGPWQFEEGAKLTQALSVLNTGSMAGTGNWHLDDVGLVVNNGTLGQGTDTLHLKASFLRNNHQMKPAQLKGVVIKGGENHGQIVTSGNTHLTCLGDWRNSAGAVMHSQGQQTVLVLRDLINGGRITALNQTVTVKGVTYNTGLIEGGVSGLTFGHLINEGILGAETSLSLSVQSGKNTGDIASRGRLGMSVLAGASFENDGKITSQQQLDLILQGKMVNKKIVTSKTILETTGEGSLENHGTFQGDQKTTIGHAETDNHGLMVEKGAVHLKPTRRFHNHLTGTVVSASGMTVSGAGDITNEAGSDDAPGFGGKDIEFTDYRGVFKNKGGRLTAEHQIKGVMATLINEGLIQAGAGYALTIARLVNRGVWQGQGHVTVGEGRNFGSIDGVGLQVTVQRSLVNEASGSMAVQSVDGAGTFINNNLLKGQGTKAQPMPIAVATFENHKTFDPGEAVTFTAGVQTWLNGEQGVIDVDTVIFATANTLSAQTLNQGVLKAKQLSLERSLENEGSLTTTRLIAKAASLTNKQTATLTVLGRSTVALQDFLNEGQAVFHQAVSGSITRIHNKTAVESFDAAKTEDARDRLEFKALNTLTGTSLTNDGLLLAPQDLGWAGADINNSGVLVTRSTTLGFTRQLVNKGLWRWSQGDLDTTGRHILNLNTFEKTTTPNAPYKVLAQASLPTDQTTTFRSGTFENRGQWLGQAQRVIAAKLINTGSVALSSLVFDVDHLVNSGTFQVSAGNLSGRIGVLDNDAILQVLVGLFDVTGTRVTNRGELHAHLGVHYTGSTLHNHGKILTPERMRLRLSGAVQNTGLLQADGGFDWHVKTFDHRHGKMIGHIKNQQSTLIVTDKLTTTKDADCQLHGLDLTTREWDHSGTLSLSAASSLKPGIFKHKGVVAAVDNIYTLLTLVTDDLQLQGVVAFYDMDVRAGRATSTSEGKLIAGNRLGFKVDGDYNHYGLFQAREFDYQGRYAFSDFNNYGRVLSSSQTSIRAHFQNKASGAADLTGVTFYMGAWQEKTFINEGTLRLAKLQSLGEGTNGRVAKENETGLVDIINRRGAKLIFEDCGLDFGVSEDKKGLELKRRGFAFGKVTNDGTIGFGMGTYHIRDDFENNGTHQVLPGQDLWYKDLINHGEINSPQGNYRIDHTRGKVTKLGKVRVNGELLLQLGDKEDAGSVIANNDIAATGDNPVHKVRVEAKTFTAPGNLNLPGRWEFDVTNFVCPYHVKAPHLKILAAYLETGNDQRFGYIESADGILDIWVRKLKNTHGKLWGKTGVKLIVEDGDLENGAARQIPDPTGSGIIYGSNGSAIASNGRIDIEVRRGNFKNIYGEVYSVQPFDIQVEGVLLNKAGHIRSGTSGKIKARRLEVTREDQGAANYVASYTTHVRKSGWGPFSSRSEWQEPNYATRYWEQSNEGIVDITKETPGASGKLDLDCPEVFVTASSLLASGLIWSEVHQAHVFDGKTLPTGFHVHDRNGHAGTLKARDGIHAKAGSMTITGSGSGKFVHMSATDFLLECLNIKRRDDLPKVDLIVDLVKLIAPQSTSQGFIQDRGYTLKGKPRFGYGVPLDQEAPVDKASLVFAGERPQDGARTEYAMESGIMKTLVRTLLSHAMGLEGLRDDIIQRLHLSARTTGQEVISEEQIRELLKKKLEAFIVWKSQRVYHDLYEIARRRGDVIALQDEVEAELHPHLMVPASVQDYRAEGGGALVDDRQGGEGVKVDAENAQFRSSYVEGEEFEINGRKMFEAETTKYVVIERSGDTVTTREIFKPQAIFMGRLRGSAVGGDHYRAVGVDFVTGEGGGRYECLRGDKEDVAAVATTTVERHETKRGRKVCGISVSGDRTTVHTSTSQQLLQTRYRSLGGIEHHVPAGTHTRIGVVNDAQGGELVYDALRHIGDAAAAVHTQSVATEKTTVFGGSSHSHYQEAASFAPNISRSTVGVRFEGQTGDLRGEVFQTPKVTDKLKKTLRVGMAKRELAHRSSSSRGNIFGAASVDVQGGQETGLPSVLMGIDGGKVDWFSDTGDTLVWSSVIAEHVGKMVVKKNFIEETEALKAWEQVTRESAGFSAPILDKKIQDPLSSSIHGLEKAEHGADQAAATLKTASDGIKAGTDGFKILQALKSGNPLDALGTLLGRWTTVSFNMSTSESSQRQSVAQPGVLNFEVLVLDNTHSHLEGHLKGKTLVALCDKLTTGPMVSTAESQAEERGGGVSGNLLTLFTSLPTLSVHESSGHTEQTTHTPTTVTVDKLFLRVNNAVFSGTQIRAKLVDAIIKGSLTIESVLDTFRSTHKSLDFSTSGDFRIEDQEKVKDKINAIASLVGTQQFYLQVGQTLLTRSAEYGFRPDGSVADVETVKTVDGREFYLRPIPEELDEFGDGSSGRIGRSLGLALGLSEEEMAPYRQGLEAIAKQGLRPKGKAEKKQVQFADAEAGPGAIKGKPQTWLSQSSPFSLETFLNGIAATKRIRINVWQNQNREGQVEHLLTVGAEDTASHKVPEVNLYRTVDHYDLLETDPSRIEAASYQTEHLQERDEESGTVINMPIGTALTLAAQLSELQELVSQAHNQAKEAGATEQEALEAAGKVKEVVEGIQDTETALAAAEAKAVEKVQQRQEALRKEKGGGTSRSSPGHSLSSQPSVDLGNPYDNLSSPIYDDIARDLRAEKLQILQAKIADLERQQPSGGVAVQAFTYLKETLTEQMAAAKADPWGAVRGAAEFIPFGIGTAAYAGNALSDLADGTKTGGEVAFEASVAYFTGKLGILACRGIKAGAKMAYKKGAPIVESFAEKMSKAGKGKGVAAESLGKTKAHGNSRQYVGDTHVYVIRDDATDQIYKVGESMQGLNKLGLSKRAEAQRRQLERITGKQFRTEIREVFDSKDLARSWETRTIERLRGRFGADRLPGNKGNR